jgi:hypothetical protein
MATSGFRILNLQPEIPDVNKINRILRHVYLFFDFYLFAIFRLIFASCAAMGNFLGDAAASQKCRCGNAFSIRAGNRTQRWSGRRSGHDGM